MKRTSLAIAFTLTCGALFAGRMGTTLPAANASASHDINSMHDDTNKLEDVAQLSVSGSATIEKPADQAQLSVGVVTQSEEARDALRQNNQRMEKIVAAITAAGLSTDEYQTGRFRIRPDYERRPRNPAADWKPRITGYTVENDISIKTKQLDLVGQLIGDAGDAGANTVNVDGFAIADPQKYRGEALGEATANAMSDARALADAAGLELVRIIRINTSSAPSPMLRSRGMRMAMDSEGGGAPPITSGNVSIDAQVSIVYEIRPSGG